MSTKATSVTLILILTALFAGHFIGSRQARQAQATASSCPTQEEKRQLKDQFESLTQTEFNDYRQLVDAQEKYEKAREIYGKAFQLFLAYLGLRYEETPFHALDQSVEKEFSQFSKTSTSAKNSDDRPVRPAPHHSTAIARPASQTSDPDKASSDKKKSWGPLRNPSAFIKNSEPIRFHPNFDKLQGSYSGKIDISDDGLDSYDITMELNYQHDGNDYTGSSFITITSPEGRESRRSGNGTNQDFKTNNQRPGDLVVEASPTSFILFRKLLKDGKWKRKVHNGYYYQLDPKDRRYKKTGEVVIRRN